MMIIVDPTKRFELIEALKEKGGLVFKTMIVEKGTEAWTLY